MNGSFDPLRLINTYGAFGTVNEERIELIVKATDSMDSEWREYEFKVKPGRVNRGPRWISPYHYRLDWQMWIASVGGGIERSPWMYNFLLKLLREDKSVLALLDRDPWDDNNASNQNTDKSSSSSNVGSSNGFEDGVRKDVSHRRIPKYIRVEMYKYKFYDGIKNGEADENPPYWIRERISKSFFPKQGVATDAILEELVQKHSLS